jgi:hypothetical protein
LNPRDYILNRSTAGTIILDFLLAYRNCPAALRSKKY